MKMTDDELLEAIWLNQLKRVSRGVLQGYMNGEKAVCRCDDFWYVAASSEMQISRNRVTSRIGENQLLRRLRRLAAAQKIDFRGTQSFFINSDRAMEAFKSARQFWLNTGIPDGYDDDNECMRTTKIDHIDNLYAECERAMLDRFAGENTT